MAQKLSSKSPVAPELMRVLATPILAVQLGSGADSRVHDLSAVVFQKVGQIYWPLAVLLENLDSERASSWPLLVPPFATS